MALPADIRHVVVLMLENQSFDRLLGFVRLDDSSQRLDGLTGEETLPLAPGDRIVLVLTASRHREAAFAAAAFLMDYLKTRAPFWKKETRAEGARWVAARDTDDRAAERWKG